MSSMVLPREISRALVDLTGEPRVDLALVLLVREYARYKMGEIDAALQKYEQKYRMSFTDYKRLWEAQDLPEHYAYEAEQDYLEWEALETRRARLEASFAWLP